MKKNTAQLKTLFTLSNLWMARKTLMALDEAVRLESGEWGLKWGQRARQTLERDADAAAKLDSLKRTRRID